MFNPYTNFLVSLQSKIFTTTTIYSVSLLKIELWCRVVGKSTLRILTQHIHLHIFAKHFFVAVVNLAYVIIESLLILSISLSETFLFLGNLVLINTNSLHRYVLLVHLLTNYCPWVCDIMHNLRLLLPIVEDHLHSLIICLYLSQWINVACVVQHHQLVIYWGSCCDFNIYWTMIALINMTFIYLWILGAL